MKPIVVVGSMNLDLVVSAPRLPQKGETVRGSTFEIFSGGKGGNQAAAAARLGGNVVMLGATGDDIFRDQLRADLKEAGVDITRIKTVRGASGTALISRDEHGDNSIVVVSGANGELCGHDLDQHRELLAQASIVLTQLEIPLATVEHLAHLTKSLGVPLMLDPAPACELPKSILLNTTWLTPNETEMEHLVGPNGSLEERAAMLLSSGVNNVLLKLGKQGAYFAGRNSESKHIAAFPVTAVDSTAAGDIFNGAFAVALSEGKTVESAGRFAAAAAAISVTRVGAQSSIPSRIDVTDFLNVHEAQ